MKDNLYFIRGGNTASYFYDENNTISPNQLKKYVNVVEINNGQEGFKLSDLADLFKNKVNFDTEEINLIIEMHAGLDKQGNYYLQSYYVNDNDKGILYEVIKANEFVEAIGRAAQDHKLNIIFKACYGGKFANYIKNLPIGSKIMITADADKTEDEGDFLHKKVDLIFKSLFKNGFKIEYLFELHCFIQTINVHNSTIYNITHEEVKQLDFESLKNKYIDSEKIYSPFVKDMFDHQIFDQSKFDQVYKKLICTEIKSLTPPCGIAKTLVHKTVDNKLEEYRQQLEGYYFSEDLSKIRFGLNEQFTTEINLYNKYRNSRDNLRRLDGDGLELEELHDKIDNQKKIIDKLTRALMNEHKYASPLEFDNLDPSNPKDMDIYDTVMSQHSIAMGLVIDHAINNGEL